MLKIKLDLVNKREYEEKFNFRVVSLTLPKSEEELKSDFDYLDLNYNNLSIQDSHVLQCKIIDTDDSKFSKEASLQIENIMIRADESGYTSPFQDVKEVYEMLTKMDKLERYKAIKVLELKRENICHLKGAIKYLNNLKSFTYFPKIETKEDYARKQIDDENITIKDIIDYIDLDSLGNNLLYDTEHQFSKEGLIIQKNHNIKAQEDEEEFE